MLTLSVTAGRSMPIRATRARFVHRDVLYNAVLDVFWLEESQRVAAEQFLEKGDAGAG